MTAARLLFSGALWVALGLLTACASSGPEPAAQEPDEQVREHEREHELCCLRWERCADCEHCGHCRRPPATAAQIDSGSGERSRQTMRINVQVADEGESFFSSLERRGGVKFRLGPGVSDTRDWATWKTMPWEVELEVLAEVMGYRIREVEPGVYLVELEQVVEARLDSAAEQRREEPERGLDRESEQVPERESDR